MSNLLPFQFPIPDGYEVTTRSGEKVTQLTKFECDANATVSIHKITLPLPKPPKP